MTILTNTNIVDLLQQVHKYFALPPDFNGTHSLTLNSNNELVLTVWSTVNKQVKPYTFTFNTGVETFNDQTFIDLQRDLTEYIDYSNATT